MRSHWAAPLLCVGFALIAACSSGTGVLDAIQAQALGGGNLCSDRLAIPDTTPDGATRKPFEDTLVRLGVLARLNRVRLAAGHYADVYDVTKAGATAVKYVRPKSRRYAAIGRICFGHIQALDIVRSVPTGYAESTVDFSYEVKLDPWAERLRAALHVVDRGVASVHVERTNVPSMPIEAGGVHGLPQQFIMWPLDGSQWYPPPKGYPANLRWPSIITV